MDRGEGQVTAGPCLCSLISPRSNITGCLSEGKSGSGRARRGVLVTSEGARPMPRVRVACRGMVGAWSIALTSRRSLREASVLTMDSEAIIGTEGSDQSARYKTD